MSSGFLAPRRVGLLGGSFNPAHEGHRHISLEALKRLGIDEVWWLVSPQNPLKPGDGMAPLAKRLAGAGAAARSPRIRVLDFETRLGTRYTVDTLTAIGRLFPRTRFVWLMGADNLQQIRHWRRWQEIFRRVPIAVLDRPTYSRAALSDLAARAFARSRVSPGAARRLADMKPPAWTFLPIKLDQRSASAIRQEKTARR
ncbi:MAG: nicotinate-nucleotide adenylyltransferase [Stellaceae bacterium]